MLYAVFTTEPDEQQAALSEALEHSHAGTWRDADKWCSLGFTGTVTADHSTAAILAAAHQWPSESEFIAVPVDALSMLPITLGDREVRIAS